MTLRLHDTMRREKVEFVPADPNRVTMYVCGPTVYDLAHVGNARPVVVFDVLYRLLKRLYPKVVYARNVTDIDDKIIDAARERGEDIAALTARTEKAFHDDMAALGALPPDVEPHATAHIAEMIELVQELIRKGYAYPADGHVLFEVGKMHDYGRLSRHSRDELIAGARVEVAPYKKDAADFVLWKPSTADQPGWPSPWGRGRPGWHLECSAMSEKHLGLPIDIHGGGQDLIFPHHENEIAQSVCAHAGGAFVRNWVHNGHVMVEGEKMSKSLGNFYTVRQLLDEGWDGEVIRFSLLSTHYRQPLDFTRDLLRQSQSALDRMYAALRNTAFLDEDTVTAESDAVDVDDVDAVPDPLEDDLNMPGAISRLNITVNRINQSLERYSRDIEQLRAAFGNKKISSTDIESQQHDRFLFSEALGGLIVDRKSLISEGAVLGILQQDPEAWFKAGVSDSGEIERLIAERNAARKVKNFAEADRIRDLLKSRGIALDDRAGGATDWKRA